MFAHLSKNGTIKILEIWRFSIALSTFPFIFLHLARFTKSTISSQLRYYIVLKWHANIEILSGVIYYFKLNLKATEAASSKNFKVSLFFAFFFCNMIFDMIFCNMFFDMIFRFLNQV